MCTSSNNKSFKDRFDDIVYLTIIVCNLYIIISILAKWGKALFCNEDDED